MINWYCHQPGQGRIGPLDADTLRHFYRQRRIDLQTLAWHAGMREWQPLERLREELDLGGVQPDASQPPPLPPPSITETLAAPAAVAARALPNHPSPPARRNNGCLIAAIVAAAAGVLLLPIFAAIALPAYNNYVERSRQAQIDGERLRDVERSARAQLYAALAREAQGQASTADTRCPDPRTLGSAYVVGPDREADGSTDVAFAFAFERAPPASGICAYTLRFFGFPPAIDTARLHYDIDLTRGTIVIACRNQDLPAYLLPASCSP